MPFTNSQNVTAGQNQQPEYAIGWFPYAIDPAASTALAIGTVLQFNIAGVGANPGPGGDAGNTPYTVPYVDAMAGGTASNFTLYAGVLVGTSSLGAISVVPNTIPGGYAIVAMAARIPGTILQVLCDNSTTIGHTLNISTSTNGALHDSGGTTNTGGSTLTLIHI